MSKKTFTIIIVSLLILALVLLVWFFFFRKSLNGTSPGDDFLKNLFPFGDRGMEIPEIPTKPDVVVPPTTGDGTQIPRLRRLHPEPVAGVVAFNAGDKTKIRFVERATGHIFESYAYSYEKIRLSNTTIPKIYEAYWSDFGDEVLMRYLKDDNSTIRTFYTKIDGSLVDQTVEGNFLDDGLKHISVFGNRVFYFTESGSEFMGVVSGMDGTKKAAVFTSGFGGFIPNWTSPNGVFLQTPPSVAGPGAMYLIDITSGDYKKVINGVFAGTGVSNTTNTAALISRGGEEIISYIMGITTSTQRRLSLQTIADKCVFSSLEPSSVFCAVPKSIPEGNYPEDWYQGFVSFNDSVWKLDTDIGQMELVFDPETDASSELDIFSISTNQDESVMVFINKKDLTPWVYLLKI